MMKSGTFPTLLRIRKSPISPKDDSLVVVHLTEAQRLLRLCKMENGPGEPGWLDNEGQRFIDANEFCKQILSGNPKWCITLLLLGEAEYADEMSVLLNNRYTLLGRRFVERGLNQVSGMLKTRKKVKNYERVSKSASRLVDMVQDVMKTHWPEQMVGITSPTSLQEKFNALQAIFGCLPGIEDFCSNAVRVLREWLLGINKVFGRPRDLLLLRPAIADSGAPLCAIKDVFPSLHHIAGHSVVFCVQSGSAMYRLNVPGRSDVDYRVVYLASSEALLSWEGTKTGVYESHADAPYGSDKHGVVEYTATELTHFVRTLSKGNPNAVELLFADDANCSSWVWQELRQQRRSFFTRRCIGQYQGYINTHLEKAKKCLKRIQTTETDSSAFSKSMYHVFHKLLELRRMLAGEDLHVALRGEEREFVYRIRTEPLVDDLDPQRLVEKAEAMIRETEESRKNYKPDHDLVPSKLEEWCLSVRIRLLAQERRKREDL